MLNLMMKQAMLEVEDYFQVNFTNDSSGTLEQVKGQQEITCFERHGKSSSVLTLSYTVVRVKIRVRM